MAEVIRAQDVVFTVDSQQRWVQSGGTRSTKVKMGSNFESLPRSVKDLAAFSFIANILAASSPVGQLALYVTDAPAVQASNGIVTFAQPVDWVLKAQSIVQVGGQDGNGNPISPPFDMQLVLNSYNWAKIGYTATSGDGLFYARQGGVEV